MEPWLPVRSPDTVAKSAKTSRSTSANSTRDCQLIKVPFLILLFSLSFPRRLQVSGINASLSRKREQRVLFMVVIMVICYLLCWLPYGIMALLATFGPRGLVTPEASIIPSILAKTSTVINPVIYVFMNKQVRVGREEGQWLSHFSQVCDDSSCKNVPRSYLAMKFNMQDQEGSDYT
ncbi:hypothetical protein L3Q82_021732 [Scortum barcoo]|uniref:Uncharacterized protein n=1 Tax=Scortum barcoo TaxID=214431 RepID=A0ACB8X5B4_9TELE|nr:hypothetical protein L3Q82_021732 [Scortum barcoo]